MVVQDKWKRKATLAYKKKHDIHDAPVKPRKKNLGNNEWRFKNAGEYFDEDNNEEEYPSLESLKTVGKGDTIQDEEEDFEYSKLQARPLTGLGISNQKPKSKVRTIQREEVADMLESVEHEKSIQEFRKRYNVQKPKVNISHAEAEEDIDSFLESMDQSAPPSITEDKGENYISSNHSSMHISRNDSRNYMSEKPNKDQSWLDELLR